MYVSPMQFATQKTPIVYRSNADVKPYQVGMVQDPKHEQIHRLNSLQRALDAQPPLAEGAE